MPVADVHHSQRQKYSSYDHLLDRSPAFHPGAVLQAPLKSTSSARSRQEFTAPAAFLPVSAQPGAAILAFSSKLFKESVYAIIMLLKSKSLQCRYAQPGRELSIADNYTVCESCDSYGHFARDCPHRKPNAVAAQNKRDVKSINWFLDQEIPKGGYVRILAESLLWEERLGKTRIRTTEGLTTCMEPHRGWTIASSSWNFLRK